jgi:hypothetical protein
LEILHKLRRSSRFTDLSLAGFLCPGGAFLLRDPGFNVLDLNGLILFFQ